QQGVSRLESCSARIISRAGTIWCAPLRWRALEVGSNIEKDDPSLAPSPRRSNPEWICRDRSGGGSGIRALPTNPTRSRALLRPPGRLRSRPELGFAGVDRPGKRRQEKGGSPAIRRVHPVVRLESAFGKEFPWATESSRRNRGVPEYLGTIHHRTRSAAA